MDLGLKGRKVILTDGGRGIGFAALHFFAREGANLAFCSRDKENVDTASKELSKHGRAVDRCHRSNCL